jgi:hypothetical protein
VVRDDLSVMPVQQHNPLSMSMIKYTPVSFIPSKEVMCGWMKIRSKVVVGGQLVWYKRYFSLKDDGWMSYYSNEKKRYP